MRSKAIITLIATLFLAAALAVGRTKTLKTTGWVSDSVCAAKGDKKCSNREHIKQGAKLVVVTDSDNKIWLVKNPSKVAGFQGEHVSVRAVETDQNTLDVKSVAKAKATEKQ